MSIERRGPAGNRLFLEPQRQKQLNQGQRQGRIDHGSRRNRQSVICGMVAKGCTMC